MQSREVGLVFLTLAWLPLASAVAITIIAMLYVAISHDFGRPGSV